jgi:uncharacterized damage-inducible protein DinB
VYAADDLLDLHRRTHVSLQKLLEHCAGFEAEALSRSLEGFGYPTILLQLHHVIGAERYWIGVLHGEVLPEEPEADFTSIDALKAFRARVAAATQAYLRGASEADLKTRREMAMWGGRRAPLVPAQVLLRTQTHIFQHQGQVAAMCRLLGRPIPPGLDFPLGE